MKLLSIEIPTCSPDVFEKYYKKNFSLWSKVKDKILFNFNFQTYTDEEIAKYVSYAESLGLEVHYIKSEYTKCCCIFDIREITHQIYPECPFNIMMDDDIAVLSETYVDTVMKLVDMMQEDPTIGVATIRTRYKSQDPLIYIDRGVSDIYTGGGIIFRNRDDKKMCPPEYKGIHGCDDLLLTVKKMHEGYKRLSCKIGATHFTHYEIRKNRAEGAVRHEWNTKEDDAKNEADRLIGDMLRRNLCDLFFKAPQD